VGEDLTALSAPTTPIQQPLDIPRNDTDPAQYDLVLPNLKRIAEESSLNASGASLGGSSKASQFAEEGGSETQQEKMLQDVSGVSTPLGTPRAERKELEGSMKGEGSVVGEGDGDMEEVSTKLKGLDVSAPATSEASPDAEVGEEGVSSETTEAGSERDGQAAAEGEKQGSGGTGETIAKVREDMEKQDDDPNKASDLADLKAGRLGHSDHQTVHADHVNPLNSAVETAFVQELGENIVGPQDDNVEVETKEDIRDAAPEPTGVEHAIDDDDEKMDSEPTPQAAVEAHNDPSRGPEAWQAEKDHYDEAGPDREDVAQERSEESGKELVTNEIPDGKYDTTGRVAGDNVDDGPEYQGNVFGATGHTEHGPGEESFAEKMVNFHVAGADDERAQAGKGGLEPDVGVGDGASKLGDYGDRKEEQEKETKEGEEADQDNAHGFTAEPEEVEQPEVVYKSPPISQLNFKNPTRVEFHSTKHEPMSRPDDRQIASKILDGGAEAQGFHNVEGVTKDDKIDSGPEKVEESAVDESEENMVEGSRGEDAQGKPMQMEIEPAPIAQPAEEDDETPKEDAKEMKPEVEESQDPVDPPSFPTPPTEEPELVEPPQSASTQDTNSNPASTPVDPTFLKSFPDVPSESKPRVEVHVSSSPISTPQKPVQTKSTDTPVAHLPGHSKSLSLSTFNSDDLEYSRSSARRGSLDVDDTPRPLGGSQSVGNLVKRGSTRRSPKSPLLDDEDPGDFTPGEGWAVVTKWVVVVYLCCVSFSWLMNPG
jgi:hypothetical protein